LPRLLHLPAGPATRLQVAPSSRSFSRAGDESASRLASSVHLAVPAMDLRVAPNFASFSVAGFTKCRVAPALRSSCSACDVGLRLPLVLHLRLYRRFDLRVSPNLSPSAVPIGRPPGFPCVRSFGIADDPFSRFPFSGSSGSRIFRPRLVVARVSPGLHLPFLPLSNLQVAPNLLLWLAEGLISRLP